MKTTVAMDLKLSYRLRSLADSIEQSRGRAVRIGLKTKVHEDLREAAKIIDALDVDTPAPTTATRVDL